MTRLTRTAAPALCGLLAVGLAAGQPGAAEKKAFAPASPPTPAVAAPPATPTLPGAEAETPGRPHANTPAGRYDAALKKWAGPAARGDVRAQFRLGRTFRRAKATPANVEQAQRWLGAAARSNLPAAHYQLGLLHMAGVEGRDPDLVEAYARFKIASAGGDVRATALVFYIGVRMTAGELRRAHERIADLQMMRGAPPVAADANAVATSRTATAADIKTVDTKTLDTRAGDAKAASPALAKPAAPAPAR